MAAIILKQNFIYNWNINFGGGYDFFDYMLRPGTFKPENHYQDDYYKDYLDYMKNDEKSDGAFDNEYNHLSDEQINEYRANEWASQQRGCPKYLGIISFENDYLKRFGIMNSRGELNHNLLKDYARQSINALIDKNKKLQKSNVYWTAAIHENTDNIHIHYQLLEYERLEDRMKKYRDQDILSTKGFEAAKSKMANLISPHTEEKAEINRIERELAKPSLAASFTNTDGRILDLYKKIESSKKPHKWQYGSYEADKDKHRREHPLKKEIDSVVRNIVYSDENLKKQYDEFNGKLKEFDDWNIYLYGHRKDIPREDQIYSFNKRNRFYKDAGNTLLQYMRDFGKELKRAEAKPKPHLSEEKIKIPAEAIDEILPNYEEPLIEEYIPDDDYIPQINEGDYNIYANDIPLPENMEDYIPPEDDFIPDEPPVESDLPAVPTAETEKPDLSEERKDIVREEKFLRLSEENKKDENGLGKLYLSEEKHNIDIAEKRLRVSAEKGNIYAQYRLGNLYLSEKRKDLDRAEKFLKLSAENKQDENGIGSYALGKLYLSEEKFNIDEAEKWLLVSAEKGNMYAQYRLGSLYLSEERKDIVKAEKYLLTVSEQGGELSQWADYSLGKLYMTDERKDYAKAEKYFLLSDGYNNPYAQCALGFLIYKTRNKLEGREWVKKAAENGNEFAAKVLPRLNTRVPTNNRYNHNRSRALIAGRSLRSITRQLQREYENHIKKLQREFQRDFEKKNNSKSYEYVDDQTMKM